MACDCDGKRKDRTWAMGDGTMMTRPITNFVPAKGDGGSNGAAGYSNFQTMTFDGGGASVPIVRPTPNSPQPAGVRSRANGRFDASREQFVMGTSTKVSELLLALPMLKADPVYTTPVTVSASSPQMQVLMRTPNSAPNEPDFYDSSHGPTPLSLQLENNVTTIALARLGMSFSALDADALGAAVQTSMNAMQWQAQAAAVAVLRKLDKAIAQGQTSGPESPVPWFIGLARLCSAALMNATDVSSGDVEKDARNIVTQIVPNGYGAGEGIDCWIGGPKVLRKLMSTPSGQSGQSGFRMDPRIGRPVYHYMGLPYYRTETDESGTGRLYGANLGPTGLSLVYVLGSAQSYGLTVDVFTSPQSLQKQAVVHGAFALMPWDNRAVYEITGIDLTNL